MIDLMALASIDRETEVTYIRRERDWATRGRRRGPDRSTPRRHAAGAAADRRGHPGRQRPRRHGNGHDHGNGHGAVRRARTGRPRVAGRRMIRSSSRSSSRSCVMGVVLGIAGVMLIFLGQDWEDALFWVLAAVMIGAGLLVVTMRDIIRCGLAMIVCFGALAGIYVLMGAPLIGAAQVIVYIGAISVLILFAIMLTQTKDAPAGSSSRPRPGRRPSPRSSSRSLIALAVGATDWGEVSERVRLATDAHVARCCSTDFVLPVRDRQRAAARGRHRRRSSWPSASRAGRREQQPRRLPDPVRDPVRHRLVRVPGPAQRDQHADVDRADAQRGQPRDRRVRRVRSPELGGAGRRSSR